MRGSKQWQAAEYDNRILTEKKKGRLQNRPCHVADAETNLPVAAEKFSRQSHHIIQRAAVVVLIEQVPQHAHDTG